MPAVRYNPRRYAYMHHQPQLGIGQLAEVELFLEQPSFEHQHGDWQMMVLLDGEVTLHAEGRVHELRPNSVCVIPPQLRHQIQTVGSRPRLTLVDVRLKLVPQTQLLDFVDHLTGGSVVSWSGHSAEVYAAAEALRGALKQSRQPEPPHILGPIWRLLARPFEPAATEAASGDDVGDPRVTYVIAAMREHLARPQSTTQLAQRVQLSTSQLSRLFARHVGVSPAAYFQRLRLEQAREYLTASTLSIKQIARMCGIANAHHFSRLFHQDVGESPRDFRRKAGTKP